MTARARVRMHTGLTAVWAVMVPLSLVTGWVESLVFVSACSLYANLAAHWGSREAALADLNSPDA